MKPTTRPTIDRMLSKARTLSTLRQNLEDFGAEMQQLHAEKMEKLNDISATLQADTENRRQSAILDATTYCCQKLARRFCDVDDPKGVIGLAVVNAYPNWKGRSDFRTYAFTAARRALQDELGKSVVSLPRKARRAGERTSCPSLDAPVKGTTGLTYADMLAGDSDDPDGH